MSVGFAMEVLLGRCAAVVEFEVDDGADEVAENGTRTWSTVRGAPTISELAAMSTWFIRASILLSESFSRI